MMTEKWQVLVLAVEQSAVAFAAEAVKQLVATEEQLLVEAEKQLMMEEGQAD